MWYSLSHGIERGFGRQAAMVRGRLLMFEKAAPWSHMQARVEESIQIDLTQKGPLPASTNDPRPAAACAAYLNA